MAEHGPLDDCQLKKCNKVKDIWFHGETEMSLINVLLFCYAPHVMQAVYTDKKISIAIVLTMNRERFTMVLGSYRQK